MNGITDHQLIERIVSRDQTALSTLYDRFSKLLYGIVLNVVRDTDDAEDILQDVFVQVWKSAATYQPDLGSPKTWLARMAHNRAIDMLRSKRYQQRKSEVRSLDDGGTELPIAHSANNTWGETTMREQATYVASALTSLPSDQRSLVEMAFFNGYTHQEIATMTGIPLGTVKTRIRTGLGNLRSALCFMADDVLVEG